MKEKNKSSFQEFEVFKGEEEKRFLNWFVIGDVFFLAATLILMFVSENVFHMNILGWKQYWILFFANATFFAYFILSLKSNFKIWLLKYVLAISLPLLVGGWIYFSDPAYTKILLAAPIMMLPMIGLIFYNSQLYLIASFAVAVMFGFLFFHFLRIGSPVPSYEIYLIYMFLVMQTILYSALIGRTKVFLKELLGSRSKLEEAKTTLEIKVKARTKELEELTKSLDQKVSERTHKLEEGRKGLLNILEDMAESKQETEEERNKTLAIITNFTDGLLVFDQGNNLALINPQAENFLKAKPEQSIGKSVLELAELPNFAPLVNLLGRKIRAFFRKEVGLEDNLVLEVSTIPIMREEEKLGSLVILHDITREKMIERIKTEFVSISAHQLRTPLSAIKWTLRMLLDGDVGKITSEQKELLEKSYKSNEEMINLISDLLNVTRIEEGKYLYKPALADLKEITQSVIDLHQEKIGQKNIKLEFQKSKEKLPKVRVDLEKIKLAIGNLVDNAINYTLPQGNITISVKKKTEGLTFQIKDTGIGIPKDQQERVFTKFFRGVNAIRMETEGSGLGLFITKNIVEAHGGKIWFETKEGKGTTFYFTLPVKD